MSASRRRQSDAARAQFAPGNDSFLDIVANMVGILIILVMVVGAQAKDAFIAQPEMESDQGAGAAANAVNAAEQAALEAEQKKLAQQGQQVSQLKSEVDELAMATAGVQQEAKSRFELRSRLQQLALAAEQLIQEERDKLDQTQQDDFDLRRSLQAAQDELEDLSASKLAVENTTAPVVQLKHLPTPMAKTVFGQEEHFRLAGGRLVYVPMNALVAQMKEQARLKVYKLKETPQITEIVGPRGGFTMKYTLVRRKATVNTGGGAHVREFVDLAGFVLVPSSGDLGEPVQNALREGSEFRNRLSQFDASTTTITIWTYPDSFGDFRRVKDVLFELGYLTAGRPMPAGHPIGGSPSGSRSGAQ